MATNIWVFCKHMKFLYGIINSHLGDNAYSKWRSDIVWYVNANKLFTDYVCKTIAIEDFIEKVLEHNNKVKILNSEFIEDIQKKYNYNMEVSFINETIKPLDTTLVLTPEFKIEHDYLIHPTNKTYKNFDNFVSTFYEKDSPLILGNNWRLHKIFANCKSTKTKKINEKYILKPEFIDEIINNYFLFVKCGWNPNE